mgnify:CR=1 FL=1|tara:strand:+ start:3716 stop:4522 length:807 start_codon:yes stop_codon:yes gene_type:complete
MHDSMFHAMCDGTGADINWGGSPHQPSWICRVDSKDPDKKPRAWGHLRLYDTDKYMKPCVKVATPFYYKGTLRCAKACGHFLKLCNGCHRFYLSRHKWDGACKGCHNAFFCSHECQSKSWGTHKRLCKGVIDVKDSDLPLAALFMESQTVKNKQQETAQRQETARLREALDASKKHEGIASDLRHANTLLVERLSLLGQKVDDHIDLNKSLCHKLMYLESHSEVVYNAIERVGPVYDNGVLVDPHVAFKTQIARLSLGEPQHAKGGKQ